MKTHFDRSKSLQELTGEDWGEPEFDSYLNGTTYRLHRTPLNEFGIEDLRIMLGQQIEPYFLVPLAIEKLEEDPLAEGDMYLGDLLSAVASVPEVFWQRHTGMKTNFRGIIERAERMIPDLDEIDGPAVLEILEEIPRSLRE